ncbi:unnamed protein product, partial [Brenthis ino]
MGGANAPITSLQEAKYETQNGPPKADNQKQNNNILPQYTTTTSAPVHTTDAAALRTVTRNIDIQNAQQNDWLVFETVMGGRDEETECKKLGCDTSVWLLILEMD